MKTGIIIQARLASTRLPGKVLLPFSSGKNILQLIVERLENNAFDVPICVATTDNKVDQPIIDLCTENGYSYFVGDEQNVLKRFIDTAEHFKFDKIVRVCADNPFLNLGLVEDLIRISNREESFDYLSFHIGSTPVIQSHIGIYSEITTLAALKRVASETTDKLYLEHVTNYMYSHPNRFRVQLIAEHHFKEPDEVRLTIDTQQDFETARKAFETLNFAENLDYNIDELIEIIHSFPEMQRDMKHQIELNSK